MENEKPLEERLMDIEKAIRDTQKFFARILKGKSK
jgi:hypothetical protein